MLQLLAVAGGSDVVHGDGGGGGGRRWVCLFFVFSGGAFPLWWPMGWTARAGRAHQVASDATFWPKPVK